MAQPFDLVLHLQFATFEFHDSQIIDRWMGQAFGDFVFQCLMSSLQFRKVRLHRHAVCLLNQWLSYDLSVAQTHDKSDGTPAFALRQTGANPLIGVDFPNA
jgi:hypothetical protein